MENAFKEFNGESCSWCANETNCSYNRRAMEATREAVRNIDICTKAYCSLRAKCDYYVKDNDKYYKLNPGDCPGNCSK